LKNVTRRGFASSVSEWRQGQITVEIKFDSSELHVGFVARYIPARAEPNLAAFVSSTFLNAATTQIAFRILVLNCMPVSRIYLL
jgi:hypothetical protein